MRYFKITGLMLMATFLLTGALAAQSVIHTISAPDNYTWGMTFINDEIWVVAGTGNNEYFAVLDPADGTINHSVPDPGDDVRGLAYDGQYLLAADQYGSSYDDQSAILKIDSNGNLVSTLTVPGDYIGGVEYVDGSIWYTQYSPDDQAAVVRVDPQTGEMLQSFPAPGPQPYGLAWDGDNFWLADEATMMIYRIDPESGDVTFSFETLWSGSSDLRDLAWDGDYLWLVENGINGKTLYQIDLTGGGTPDVYVPVESYDFGQAIIGTTLTGGVQVANLGDADLEITFSNPGGVFSIVEETFPVVIEPNDNYYLELRFSPQIAGFFSAVLTVATNDPDEQFLTLQLFGEGLMADPNLLASPPEIDFGTVSVGSVAQQSLFLTNSGAGSLIIDEIYVTSFEGGFTIPDFTLPLTLSTWDTLAVPIHFAPFQGAAHTAALGIFSNDPDSPQLQIMLSGLGQTATQYGGDVLWHFQAPEDVNVIAPLDDLDNDGLLDVVFESYGTMSYPSHDHLFALKSNSFDTGIPFWMTPASGGSGSGGYGDKCLAPIPDVNDDGIHDVAVGTAWGGQTVSVHDGLSGDVIWYFETETDPAGPGWVYTVDFMPDISGDGTAEVLAGSGSSANGLEGKVGYCFNGATGAVIWRYYAPDGISDVMLTDDVNGDGIPDVVFAVGTNAMDYRVVCVNGASQGTATVLWNVSMAAYPYTLAGLSDMNDDGITDVAVGLWNDRVLALDGASGQVLWSKLVGGYVMRLECLGDVNGDDLADVIVGSWYDTFYALNGVNGQILWGYPTNGDVWSVGVIGDLDSDGINEGLGGSFDGNVYCVSGASGALLWQRNLGAKIFTLSSIADISHDGWPDVLAGTQFLNANGGQAYAIEGGDEATPVDLVSFTGETAADGIRLQWEFNGTDQIAGFNLYRQMVKADQLSLNEQHAALITGHTGDHPSLLSQVANQIRLATYDSFDRLNDQLIVRNEFIDNTALIGHTYIYQLGKVDLAGVETLYTPLTMPADGSSGLAAPRLIQNYPNPFSEETTIAFSLPATSEVTVDIFNAAGQKVITLLSEEMAAGQHQIRWNGLNDNDRNAAPGVYYYQLQAHGQKLAAKMILLP